MKNIRSLNSNQIIMKIKHIDTSRLDGCINTYSGEKFNLLDTEPEMVNIEDIARGLAYKPHFGGQTPAFFSVAQHCLMVCQRIQQVLNPTPSVLLLALLHDAAEAYIGDMIKPLKVHLPVFCEVEDQIMKAICARFSLNFETMPIIKPFDIEVQEMEYRQFYKGESHFIYMNSEEALYAFKSEFNRIKSH